ncbi:MAG: THUMP domain-containing class I SAM-dependent RNA methyltransferase, partial [Saprospiraceae bacterium]
MQLIAKTFHGLEQILAQEIKEIGGQEIEVLNRAVSFNGDKEVLYRANYELRTALRIIQPIYKFQARSERVLTHKILSYNWAKHLNVKQTFAIDSVANSRYFKHSKYLALKVKDGIVDQFRKKEGIRPDVDVYEPDVRFNVHVFDENFTISIDTSGQSLHRRGYRIQGHEAPLNEVLAAGMVALSGWKKEQPLYDLMCGSGTILFEAAMKGANIAPGKHRSGKYGFMYASDFDQDLWNKIVKENTNKEDKSGLALFGNDIAPISISICEESADRLGLEDVMKFQRLNFKKATPETTEPGVIIMNPPYGERLKEDAIEEMYKALGDQFKTEFSGFDAYVFSSNIKALKRVGLRPSRKIPLFNGPFDCRMMKFELYRGTRKV